MSSGAEKVAVTKSKITLKPKISLTANILKHRDEMVILHS